MVTMRMASVVGLLPVPGYRGPVPPGYDLARSEKPAMPDASSLDETYSPALPIMATPT